MAEVIGEAVFQLSTDASKFSAGVDKAGKQAQGLGNKLAKIGKIGLIGAAAGVTAVGVGLGVAVGKAAAFDQKMLETRSLLSGMTDTEFAAMKKAVLGVSSDFGVLAEQATGAFYDIVSAGVPAAQQIETLEQASILAKAGVASVGESTDLLTSSINTFGKSGLTATEIADKWFTVVKLGKTTVAELGASVGNFANDAVVAGASLDEVGAALALMTTQGISTSQAGTKLRQLFVELQKPGKDLETVLDHIKGQLGFGADEAFNLQEAIGEHGLAKVLATLEGGMGALGVTAAQTFGSVEASGAFVAVTGDNLEKYTANVEAMTGAQGAATEAFDTMNSGVTAQWDIFKNKLNNVLISAGTYALPLLSQALEWAANMLETHVLPAIDRFALWFEDNKPRIIAFVKDVWAKAKPFLEGFMSGLGLVWEAGKKLVEYFKANKPELIAVLLAIGAAIVVALGPVSLAVAAILGIITLAGIIKNNWGTIKAFFQGVWDGIKTTFKNGVNGLIGIINSFIRTWNALELKVPGFSQDLPFGKKFKVGGFTIGVPDIPTIPTLDAGAIVTEPTIAALAVNRKPEGVIPLDDARAGRMLRGETRLEFNNYGTLVGNEIEDFIKEGLISLDQRGFRSDRNAVSRAS